MKLDVTMLSFHPLADVFPLMQGKEFDEFIASIKNNGLRDAIVIYEGKILDGRNRYRACLVAGIKPRTEQFNGGGNPALFVLDRNCHRRHLNESQRAMAVAKLATLTVGRPKSNSEQVPNKISSEEVGKIARVSGKTIRNAKTIYDHGTVEEIESVVSGKAKVTPTAKAIRKRSVGDRRKGKQLKTLVREFERHVELLCTSCEHFEDIEIPQLNAEQKNNAIQSIKAARIILSRFIQRLGGKNG